MHEIAVNVIVHYKARASVVFLCLFMMLLIRKARGCCMHVFSSISLLSFSCLTHILDFKMLIGIWDMLYEMI
jgi:hypothetical protein